MHEGNQNENTHGRCMAVMLEVVLSGASFHDMPRQDRRSTAGPLATQIGVKKGG